MNGAREQERSEERGEHTPPLQKKNQGLKREGNGGECQTRDTTREEKGVTKKKGFIQKVEWGETCMERKSSDTHDACAGRKKGATKILPNAKRTDSSKWGVAREKKTMKPPPQQEAKKQECVSCRKIDAHCSTANRERKREGQRRWRGREKGGEIKIQTKNQQKDLCRFMQEERRKKESVSWMRKGERKAGVRRRERDTHNCRAVVRSLSFLSTETTNLK